MDEDDKLSEQERAAVKERAAELKKQAKNSRAKDKAAANAEDVRAKIAGMPDGDRELAQRVHDIVADVAPALEPKLYYGQPGYARNGKVVCFFRSGQQDKERYSTFGFSAQADLDEPDGVWATSYALTDPGEKAWDHLATLIRRAGQE